MSTRKLCFWGVPLLVVALAGAAYYFFIFNHHQVIVFSDDAKLTLLAVDYGKKHVPPPVKTSGTAPRPRRANAITTTNDTLVLWVQQQYDSKEWHSFQYYVYDKDDKACVQAMNYGGNGRGNEVIGIRLDAFPRRQSKFYVRVQENSNGNNETAEKKFTISNPAGRTFADWTPDSFPVAKDDDDVSVTLTKLVAGAPMGYTRNDTDSDDPMNKGVEAIFHVERNGAPVSNWAPVSVVTTDATGNSVNGYINNNMRQNDVDSVVYQWGLWPDEAAWKVRFEFSQQSDFAYNELWTVPNIPVRAGRQNDFWNYNVRKAGTNETVAETDLNGIHLKIFPAISFTDSGNSQQDGGLVVEADSQNLNGMRMTVKIADDHANNIDFWDNGSYNNGKMMMHRYQLRDLADSTNLTVSVALHKSRYVEFTVKPQKAPASTDSQ